MISVKVKFRPSTVDGKEGSLYYQIIYKRVPRQFVTDYKIKTLMQDPVYRSGVAAEQTAYNQPPHVGFYMGKEVFETRTLTSIVLSLIHI